VLQFVVVSARRAAGGRAWTAGLRRALLGSRTRTAAYIAHLGMVLIVAGLLGSAVYKTETGTIVDLAGDEPVRVGEYSLTYRACAPRTAPKARCARTPPSTSRAATTATSSAPSSRTPTSTP
jgi:cytochrome c biogenesis factor